MEIRVCFEVVEAGLISSAPPLSFAASGFGRQRRRLRFWSVSEVSRVTDKQRARLYASRNQRQRFYATGAWRAMSRFIRQRDGWLCTACRPRRVAAELVHHVKPLSAWRLGAGPRQPN